MTPHDDDDTTPAAQSAPITRRELLKELSKAPMMGAMLLPTAWATPLMQFAQVGAAPVLSLSEGQRKTCSATSVSIAFGAGDSASAFFYISWFGVSVYSDPYTTSYQCSVKLTRATGKARLSPTNELTMGLVSGPATISSSTSVDWTVTDALSPKITVAMNSPKQIYGNSANADFGDGTNSFVVDLQITGSAAAGYTLDISRFESRQCPYT